MISGIKLGERTIDRPVFSEDGRFLAARCFTNQIRIWDTVSLREIASFAGQAVPLPRGFSRNGKTLLMYAAGKLKLYDVGSQTIARETLLENPPKGARGLALSTSAGLFAVSDQDKNVQLWDISTGRRIANLTMEPVQLRFSPDGTMLAGSELLYETSRRIHFWTPPSLAPLGSIASHEAAYIGIEFDFSPNGRLLATAGSQNRAVHLWDLSARRPMAILKGHRQETSGIAFSHDGRLLASSSSDGTIKLWDLSIRQEIATLVFNESGVKEIDSRVGQLYFSPEDSALLAVSYDGTGMRLFRAPTWEEIAKSEKGIDVEVK
jgi:WD40 repeat protein